MTKLEKKPRLPKEVEIREGEKEAVVWELSSEQYEEEGRFLAEGYSEDDRIKAEAEVIVSESEPEAETVYLTAESEESPELPKAVLVTIGNVIEEFPAEWEEVDWEQCDTSGTVEISGQVPALKITCKAEVTVDSGVEKISLSPSDDAVI